MTPPKKSNSSQNPLDIIIEENKHLKRVVKRQDSIIVSYKKVLFGVLEMLEEYEPESVARLRGLLKDAED